MDQLRGVRAHLQSGTATVRQIWTANGALAGATPFQSAETVSWGIDGAGVYVTDDGSAISFYRTSGTDPAVGDTITGDTSTASFVISTFPAENLSVTNPRAAMPVNWNSPSSSQGQISAGDEVFLDSDEPVGIVSGTIGHDSFDLTANWSGTSPLTNVEIAINRSQTSLRGWEIPEQGSRFPFRILKETLRAIDAWTGTVTGAGSPTSYTPLTLAGSWVNVTDVSEPRPALAYSYEPASDTVRLRGLIDTAGATVAQGSDIVAAAGLPSNRRPLYRMDFDLAEPIAIHPDGSITFEGLGGGPPSPISFNGVAFRPGS